MVNPNNNSKIGGKEKVPLRVVCRQCGENSLGRRVDLTISSLRSWDVVTSCRVNRRWPQPMIGEAKNG